MANLEISNLNSAGSDLFAGVDSFLNELQTTETAKIFGGFGQNRRRCVEPTPPTPPTRPTPPICVTPPTPPVCRPVPCFTSRRSR
jgi:hypothetical protein